MIPDRERLSHPPVTHHVNAEQALRTLSHTEMTALSCMYERWAFTETKITPDDRTKLIQWSSDYERLAEYAGTDWCPPEADEPLDAAQFIARREAS